MSAEEVLALLPLLDASPNPGPDAQAAVLEHIASVVREESDGLDPITLSDAIAQRRADDLERRAQAAELLEDEAAAVRAGDTEEDRSVDAGINPLNGATEVFEWRTDSWSARDGGPVRAPRRLLAAEERYFHRRVGLPARAPLTHAQNVEATTGIEPVYAVLQTAP